MQMSSSIQLVPYTEEYKEALQTYTLPEEQVQFTAHPTELLDYAKQDTTRNPIVILVDEKPVGIFSLQSGSRVQEYTNKENSLLLTSFSINFTEQGNGYAKRALQLLPNYVGFHFPNIEEIVLAVNERNIPAQKLYIKVGFEDRGHRKMGPIGLQLVLYLSLSAVKAEYSKKS
ncbi:GNAT family N-acetyltransferase [Bacillus cytotoxicus]|uniref:GNAT family N-acetyltransferase n=1 Tax=Bacillus cytotoxicus TaxID=580165 RepID=A0ACC6AAY1_9BACI|nr:GNAT family N-acetyltransferase [Bacillus cytotoxicus]